MIRLMKMTTKVTFVRREQTRNMRHKRPMERKTNPDHVSIPLLMWLNKGQSVLTKAGIEPLGQKTLSGCLGIGRRVGCIGGKRWGERRSVRKPKATEGAEDD
jgi:hypothetical protein